MGRRSALCKALGVAQINRGAMPPNPFVQISQRASAALQPAFALEEEAGAER